MEFYDAQLEEISSVYPWMYDFAGIIRLMGGFATSILLYVYQAYGAPFLELLQEQLPS